MGSRGRGRLRIKVVDTADNMGSSRKGRLHVNVVDIADYIGSRGKGRLHVKVVDGADCGESREKKRVVCEGWLAINTCMSLPVYLGLGMVIDTTMLCSVIPV